MQLIKLKSKIHRATITHSDLNYEGSITIDRRLLRLAQMEEFEQVQIYNISSGARFTTYTLQGEEGSGIIQINGAAARLVQVSDLIIIACYANYETEESQRHQPVVVQVNPDNSPL